MDWGSDRRGCLVDRRRCRKGHVSLYKTTTFGMTVCGQTLVEFFVRLSRIIKGLLGLVQIIRTGLRSRDFDDCLKGLVDTARKDDYDLHRSLRSRLTRSFRGD